ncbi:AAA family ATPase [Nocardioides mesophilus]|uniref:AAA family ATPase n=1 Tax=Nocardioides mesophilus TaxID=433659 RepID=A0A7G9RCI5_9ACTN|nr:AAA family ATPase [Nocardioides mesophilus]QNN53310.1 AAA family ATPase [Nocardioides mesophilus]
MTASAVGVTTALLDAPGPLLSAKLSVPKPRELVVPRRRLFEQLTEGLSRPLTVVSGPPGSGKTTLVASWIAHELAPGTVAWLTLDEGDTPSTFWRYVVESLRRHGVELPSDLGALRRPIERPFLEQLATALADCHGPVILVLDQFESITSPALLRDLDFVLTNAASELRLVLTTRSEPRALASRRSLRGELSRIGTADLAFDRHEAEALLAQHGIHLTPKLLDGLEPHVQGWAAGLRMCATALRRQDPAGFIASLPSVPTGLADYLVEEVLDRRPGPVREFLLQTSVVDRLCPDLADALTGGTRGADLLARLARENVLVEAVDQPPGWYRFHPMLAEVLRVELRRRHPDTVADLHRRAACWFASRLAFAPVLENPPTDADDAMAHVVAASVAMTASDLDLAIARLDRAEALAATVPAEDRSVFDAAVALVRSVIDRRLIAGETPRSMAQGRVSGI